mgnify:CR=1 FL=1
MMEIIINMLAVLLPFMCGWYVGSQQNTQRRYPRFGLSDEERHEILNAYLRSRFDHPSNRGWHPENEDD